MEINVSFFQAANNFLLFFEALVYSFAPCFFFGRWKYMCVELLSGLQRSYPGSNYQLLEVHLYKDTGDYYIDTVQLGRAATVSDPNGL